MSEMKIAPAPKYRLPKWHSTNRWRLRVCMERTKSGKLDYRSFYWVRPFGETPPPDVVAEAVQRQQDWDAIVADWPVIRGQLVMVYTSRWVAEQLKVEALPPGDRPPSLPPLPDYAEPEWVDRDALAADVAQAKQLENRTDADLANRQADSLVRVAGERVRDDPAVQHDLIVRLMSAGALPRSVAASVPAERVTLEQAVDQYIKHERDRVGLRGGKGLKTGTFNGRKNNLLISIGKSTHVEGRGRGRAKVTRSPLDVTQPLVSITKPVLTQFVNFWLGADSGVSDRTAKNYCATFRAFLDWADAHEPFGFTKPKGTDALFTIRNVTPKNIADFDPEVMTKLLDACTSRTKLYVYLMLNCGYQYADKRGLLLSLPQSKETFTIPPNVYLLGTMNTADRSIKLLDAALRRRFTFLELMPDTTPLEGSKVGGLALDEFLRQLNARVAKREGREKQIGHSFVLDGERPVTDPDEFSRRFRQEILPLLQEYCYDEYGMLAEYIGTGLVDVDAKVLNDEVLSDADSLVAALASEFPPEEHVA